MVQGLSAFSDSDAKVGIHCLYKRLRSLARQQFTRQRCDHMLQPTALVHEAWLRLSASRTLSEMTDGDLLPLAAKAMRSVLVDYARSRQALKRHAEGRRIPLDDALATFEPRNVDLLTLDDALQRLDKLDPGLTRLIDLRFFGGLNVTETAEALGVSERTVRRGWSTAKAWLRRELSRGDTGERGTLAAS